MPTKTMCDETTGDEARAAQLEARLVALEEEYARKLGALEREVAALRGRTLPETAMTAPHAAPVEPVTVQQPERERPSRRGLLRTALGAAAGVSAVSVLRPSGVASANTGDPVLLGTTNVANAGTQVKWNGGAGFTGVILLGNDTGFANTGSFFPAAAGGWAGGGAAGVPNGVYGYTQAANGHGVVGLADSSASNGMGVLGEDRSAGGTGVSGSSDHGTGVKGSSDSTAGSATAIIGTITSASPGGFSAGVRGVNNGTGGNGIGVYGSQAGGGWGVYGTSVSGIGGNFSGGSGTGVSANGATGVAASGTTTGVRASSGSGTAVSATSTSGTAVSGVSTSGTGVLGQSNGDGDGIVGFSNTGNGFHGHSTSGHGVFASSLGSGAGIRATSTSGYGAELSGGLAPIRLDPASTAGAPSGGSHHQGELFVDKNGVLYFCTVSGTPGTWKKVTLT
jgi:hypothetical protein